MARANLSALLGGEGEPKADAPTIPVETVQLPVTSAVTRGSEQLRKTARLATAESPAAPAGGHDDAPYLRLVRKETRVREDQYEALTVNARRLTRAKSPGGERITENTLIRVAIDLLLNQAEKLAGSDETRLRESVGL